MKYTTIAILVILVTILGQTASAQDTRFPNELKGYEFFGSGRFQDLKLLVSTKADVKRVMGKHCEHGCDYDPDWTMTFAYVNDRWSKKANDLAYKAKEDLIGTLASISFRPRRPIVLTAEDVLPSEFTCNPPITTSGPFAGEFRSQICMDDKRVIYAISRDAVNVGGTLTLKRQITYIDYAPPEKDFDAIFVLADK